MDDQSPELGRERCSENVRSVGKCQSPLKKSQIQLTRVGVIGVGKGAYTLNRQCAQRRDKPYLFLGVMQRTRRSNAAQVQPK